MKVDVTDEQKDVVMYVRQEAGHGDFADDGQQLRAPRQPEERLASAAACTIAVLVVVR